MKKHPKNTNCFPQIIYVTGKGGVGKSTIAMLIGEALANEGKRCILVELNGNRVIPNYYNLSSLGYKELRLLPNLYCLSISPEEAIQEYLLQQLKFKTIVELFTKNKVISPLLQNAPGLHDAVQLGKIYSLAEQDNWDHVIIDGPATGHGEILLDAAKTLMDMTQIGPMYQSNKIVDHVLRDHNRCKIIIVTLLEEMVVQETMQLLSSFGQRSDRKNQMGAIVINRYQNRLMNIDPSEIDAVSIESLQNRLNAINEHIREHNEHVELEVKQYNRLQSFLKQKGVFDVPSLKIPFLSDLTGSKAQLYLQMLSVLEQAEGSSL